MSLLTPTLWLGAALFGVAALAFVLARESTRKLRAAWVLAIIQVGLVALQLVLIRIGHPKLAEQAELWHKLITVYAWIRLLTVLVFDVLLFRFRSSRESITQDIAIGALYILSTFAILRSEGLNPAEVVATGAVVSAVVALSLQSTLGNILGGIALQLDGSVHVGDWVQLEGGKQGRVTQVRWRHTVVETRDWDTIIVPNANLLASNIHILGRRDGQSAAHRQWVHFHVDHRFAPAEVVEVVTLALRRSPVENVAFDPAPNVICLDLAHERRQSFSLYAVRYWLTDLNHDDATSSLVRGRVQAALTRAGIPLALPATMVFEQSHDDAKRERDLKTERTRRMRALNAVPFFQVLSEDERSALVEHLSFAPFARGETMTRQGAVAHWLYLLVSGSAEVRALLAKQEPGDTATPSSLGRVVREMSAPDVFGEAGLMLGEARMASVVATTDVECFRLDKEGFERVLRERPEVAEKLSALMAERRVQLSAVLEQNQGPSSADQERRERERMARRIREFFGL